MPMAQTGDLMTYNRPNNSVFDNEPRDHGWTNGIQNSTGYFNESVVGFADGVVSLAFCRRMQPVEW
jgi:hypothetical protein